MSENITPAKESAAGGSTATPTGAVANTGYRVSMVPGALEVSARLVSAEDLAILVKVLEANKAILAKATD